mgnify:CR=1 FL=1
MWNWQKFKSSTKLLHTYGFAFVVELVSAFFNLKRLGVYWSKCFFVFYTFSNPCVNWPALLACIQFVSDQRQASLCSVRRTHGRLTVVHQRIVLRECCFEQSAKIIVRALPLTSNALPSLMKYSQWCRDFSPRNYNGCQVYIWPYLSVNFSNNFGWATPNCWHKILFDDLEYLFASVSISVSYWQPIGLTGINFVTKISIIRNCHKKGTSSNHPTPKSQTSTPF